MATGDHGPETLRRYSEAQGRLEHAGGYAWRERSLATLRELGFADAELDRRLETFSGGELTRASLARALAGDPDLLLLDEPTNHLDVDRLEWLERTLVGLDAAVILVAHDRWFLEATTTAVLELEAGRSTYFPGQWHLWRREKAARSLNASKAIERYEADIARLQRFVDRFRYKKSKAKQAQAKLSHIGRLQEGRAEAATELALLERRSRRLGFDFLKPPRSGRTVVEVEGLDLAAGDKDLLADVSFAIERGEHVALVGPNGSGKTTLLETLLDRRPVAAGAARLGHGVIPAYFSQHEAELDERGSVLDCVQSMTSLARPQAQNLLGRFLFSGWEAHEKPVSVLSGGERRRLALAVVVASGANLLVLDEPTNHLDLESREALESALENFPATVLLVSHDRALLDAVAERTLAIGDGTIRSYDGGWADYVRAREARSSTNVTPPVSDTGLQRSQGKPRPERPEPRRSSELERIEADIARREEALAELERRLAVGLGRRRSARRPPRGAGRAPVAARALGDAVRAGADLTFVRVGRMSETRDFLRSIGLPGGDLNELPDSAKRFPDGAQYRVEIPSTEGPRCLEAVLEEAARLEVTVHRVSQGSGVFLLTDEELDETARLAADAQVEVSLFARPNAGWDTSAMARSAAGAVVAPSARGQEQVVACLDDARRAAEHGFRSVLIADLGVLAAFADARRAGFVPAEMQAKVSVMLPAANAAAARVLADLGADTINLPTDLSLAQIAAIRATVDVPLDVYVEAPDNVGGFVRLHEIPELIRVASPVYVKFGLRNAPDVYPAGTHLEATTVALSRERVRRARLGMELLARSGYEPATSELGAAGLAVPQPVAAAT